MVKTNIEKVCEISDSIFYEQGFPNAKTFPYLGDQYLVLFDSNLTPENYRYGQDSCVHFGFNGKTLDLQDLWVRSPFSNRQGVGKKIVNGCLTEIARVSDVEKIEAYSLSTPAAQGFWRNLEGWKDEGNNIFIREVRK